MEKLAGPGGDPIILNRGKPLNTVEARGNDSSPARWATQCDAQRCIDLGIASGSLEGRVELLVYNGTHCREHDKCQDPQCKNVCGSDHWGLEVVFYERKEAASLQPKAPKRCRVADHWKTVTDDMQHLLAHWLSVLGPSTPITELHGSRQDQHDGMEFLALGAEALHYIMVLRALTPRRRRALNSVGNFRSSCGSATPVNMSQMPRLWALAKEPDSTRPSCLLTESGMLTPEQSHAAWCVKVEKQAQPQQSAPDSIKIEVREQLTGPGRR